MIVVLESSCKRTIESEQFFEPLILEDWFYWQKQVSIQQYLSRVEASTFIDIVL